MKPVLNWVKAHWAMLALGVVAIAALPASVYFSMVYTESMRAKYEGEVKQGYEAVSRNDLSYHLVTIDGTTVLENRSIANKQWIERYKELAGQNAAEAAKLLEEGLAFNKNSHTLLIEGLFPEPTKGLESSKKVEFLEKYAKQFHNQLLDYAHAGMPPASQDLAIALNQYMTDALERHNAQSGGVPMTDDQKRELRSQLFSLRLAQLRDRAGQIGFYGDFSMFSGLDRINPLETDKHSMVELWNMQEKAWIHSDVLRAVARVNAGSMDETRDQSAHWPPRPKGGVAESVVKRVLKIDVIEPKYADGTPKAFEQGLDKAPTDYSKSLTGRTDGPGSKNKWYDIREINLEFIASSQRLPMFIDALALTNFISVLSMDIRSVDARQELAEGYSYGDEHVVRVTMRLEFVLLRSWRKDWMPEDVKKALGMVEGVQVDQPAAPRAPHPHPPKPAGGAKPIGGGDDDLGGG